ncbi:hypothetical protein [Streptomyces sp. NPDC020141]|uniref:hypothetical protein n=1 Tax=Streptomyces sp. NPDC020141 TaxID=3365065 RepID=UPI0037AA4B44
MTMQIYGEDWTITPEVWEVFQRWYGDKAYRKAGFVAEIEGVVRECVAADLRNHAPTEWALDGRRAGHTAAAIARGGPIRG